MKGTLARTRDAQQFQVQTEVALLTACDVDGLSPAPAPSPLPTAAHVSTVPIPAMPVPAEPGRSERSDAVVAPPTDEAPASVSDTTLKSRWPDVIEQVRSRNGLLASALGSASPLAIDGNALVVAFATDFNRNSAEKPTSRQLIERAFERVFGTAYRLRCTVKTEVDGGTSIQDDPVINYAVRTFGGEPRRVAEET